MEVALIIEDDVITVDSSEALDVPDSRYEYYMNRDGVYYFRNHLAKFRIKADRLPEIMHDAKYGDRFEIDLS